MPYKTRQYILQRIAEGTLPARHTTVWPKRGSGRACGGCERVVRWNELEYELRDEVPGTGEGLRLHLICYLIWYDEVRSSMPGGTIN